MHMYVNFVNQYNSYYLFDLLGKQFNHQIQNTQPILITEMRKYVENCHSDGDSEFHAQFEVNEIC